MTLLGKIFIVLIFVMSIFFMAVSVVVFATHKNWKEIAEERQKEVGKAQVYNEALVLDIERLKYQAQIEKAARAQAVAVLDTRWKQAQEQLVAKERELATSQVTLGQQSEALRATQEQLTAATRENGNLRDGIRQAQEDLSQQIAAVVTKADENHQLQRTEQGLTERFQQLQSEHARAVALLASVGKKPTDSISDIPPRVDGIVTAVGDKDLVEISIGSDDGLKVGHQLEVWRGSTYVGRVLVEQVAPDGAVTRIDRRFLKSPIQKGDKVATKII